MTKSERHLRGSLIRYTILQMEKPLQILFENRYKFYISKHYEETSLQSNCQLHRILFFIKFHRTIFLTLKLSCYPFTQGNYRIQQIQIYENIFKHSVLTFFLACSPTVGQFQLNLQNLALKHLDLNLLCLLILLYI